MIKLNFLQSIGGIWESCQTNCHTSSKSYYALVVCLRFLWFICCTFAHVKWRLFIATICDSRYTNTISGSIYSWKGYSLPKGFQVSLHREIFLKPLAVTFYSKTYTFLLTWKWKVLVYWKMIFLCCFSSCVKRWASSTYKI